MTYTSEATMDKPQVTLLGEDGNAFAILGACRKAARSAGWSTDRYKAFSDKAMAGNYDHLLQTVMDEFEVD